MTTSMERGWLKCLFKDDQQSLYEATIPAFGRTSRHHHNFAAQLIWVKEGWLRVTLYHETKPVEEHTLCPADEPLVIEAGVQHRLEAYHGAAVKVLELYRRGSEPLNAEMDIVRHDEGGFR